MDASSADAAPPYDAAHVSDGNPAEGSTGADLEGGADASWLGDAGCGAAPPAIPLNGPVDIVVAVDTSGSLNDEVCNVITNLQRLAERIRLEGAQTRLISVFAVGVDLVYIAEVLCGTTDLFNGAPLTMDAARYQHFELRVGSGEPLRVLLDAFDQYKGALRAQAVTHFVVITDDDSLVSGSDFQAGMQQKLGHAFHFHSISADGGANCRGTTAGTTFQALADLNHGTKLSICAADWSPLLACRAP